MGESVTVVLNQALIFFLFMAVGFILCKIKVAHDKFGKVLSQVLLYVILPALRFKTFAQSVSKDTIAGSMKYFICGLILTVVMFLIAMPMGKAFSKNSDTINIYRYALCVPNIGYFGYPMMSAVFGEQALANTMVFTLPLEVFIYTVALYMLDPQKKLSLKKLINPNIVSVILGIAAGLMEIKIPQLLLDACNSASVCMSPLAMIMTGFILGGIPLKRVIAAPKPYIVSGWRLIIIPALLFGILWLIGVDKEVVIVATAMYAMPVGLNAVIFPEAYGGDSKTGAQVCFISTILALITLPIVFWAMQMLVK